MVRLTKRIVDGADASVNDVFLWDDEVPGFGLRVFTTGRRSYLIQYRVGQRTRRCTIGTHGIWTVEMARREAKILLGQVAHGEDPVAEKLRATLTVGDLCDWYLDEGLITAKDSSIRQAKSNIDNHIKPLVGWTLATRLCKAYVQQLLRDVAAGKTARTTKLGPRAKSCVRGGKGTANRVVTTLCSVMGFGIDNKVREDNPALAVKNIQAGSSSDSSRRSNLPDSAEFWRSPSL